MSSPAKKLRIGVDFDNTIACYDTAFPVVARELEFYASLNNVPKEQIKNLVLAGSGGELDWQKLQGQVYGRYIHLATVFPGFIEFLCHSKLNGHSVFIISHKSEYGHFDRTAVNLRDAALSWMTDNGILGSDDLQLQKANVFFEHTREAKINRIYSLECTHFIDDLAVVLRDPLFPDSVERILFAPDCWEKFREELKVAPSWRMINYDLFDNWTIEEVCLIAQKKFASLQVCRATPRRGRGNSKIFELGSQDGKKYALKIYPDRQLDSRPRLETEFVATRFLEAAHLPVAYAVAKDERLNWAVYKWTEGKSQITVDKQFVEKAISFVVQLLATSRQSIDRISFSAASEACLSGSEITNQIQHKLTRLSLLTSPEINLFLNHDLLPVLRSQEAAARRQLLDAFDTKLLPEQQILSPSDFGAHNSIEVSDGRYIFIDFEYFGWDDPVKLVSDFFWHPAMNLTNELRSHWITGTKSLFIDDLSFSKRLDVFLPLIGIRWCLIMLNEFLPSSLARRVNADPSRFENTALTLSNQLRKSKALLQEIINLGTNGPAIQTS